MNTRHRRGPEARSPGTPARGPLLACVALALTCALFLTELLLGSRNTLYSNDRWVVRKRMMEIGVTGGDEMLLTRSPLAGGELDLGSWDGCQEVVSRQALLPTRIGFRFRIEEGSWLDLTYNRTGDRHAGIRLSRRGDSSGAAFEGNEEGAFISRHLLPLAALGAGWHEAVLEFSDPDLLLRIDAGAPVRLPSVRFATGSIGFRGGLAGALVDDVTVATASGAEFRESFHSTAGRGRAFLAHLAIVALAAGIRFWVALRVWRTRDPWLAAARFLAAATLVVLYGYGFDRLYWSRRPFRVRLRPLLADTRPLRTDERLELARDGVFAAWGSLLGGEPVSRAGISRRGYPDRRIWSGPVHCAPGPDGACVPSRGRVMTTRTPPGRRMLFIGASQFIGAGAERLEETIFVRTHRLLDTALANAGGLESLNISVSGQNMAALLADYPAQAADFSPDLVVVDLPHAGFPEDLETVLGGFLAFNRARGIRTVLVEEARCGEIRDDTSLRAAHRSLRRAAARDGAPALALHEFLARPEVLGSGMLWWDEVHMTSFGQYRAAHWLAPLILPSLASETPAALPAPQPDRQRTGARRRVSISGTGRGRPGVRS